MKKKIYWSNGALEVAMTLCSFVCFVLIYVTDIMFSIVPHYFLGLFLAIPSIIFFMRARKMVKDDEPRPGVTLGTFILIPVLIVAAIIFLLFLGDTSTPIRNPKYYKRIINSQFFREEEVFAIFPDEIPKDAFDIKLYYESYGFQDITTRLCLRFGASYSTINEYLPLSEGTKISKNDYGYVFEKMFGEDNTILDDFDGYLIADGHWKASIILVNQSSNEIIFYGVAANW